MPTHPELYFEDLPIGRTFTSPPEQITAPLLAPFRHTVGPVEDDPLPPIVVAALTMRLLLQSPFRAAEGVLGAGVQSLSWPAPARLGDLLHVEIEVIEARRSRSRPDRGLVTTRNLTKTGAGETVQIAQPTILIPTREDRSPVNRSPVTSDG